MRTVRLNIKNRLSTASNRSIKLNNGDKAGRIAKLEELVDKLQLIEHPKVIKRVTKDGKVFVYLPEKMNFSTNYEETSATINMIRIMVGKDQYKYFKGFRLASVNFEGLKHISTSAALVLTSELSRWDDFVAKSLVPKTKTWSPKIATQLFDLGFFNLFENQPNSSINPSNTNLKFVKYIKGKTGEKSKTRQLKDTVHEVIGGKEKINKWTFLDSGLSEAIMNVTHHAYPKQSCIEDNEKNWYLTGSYNSETNTLKIAFYDQGIGIPSSLPTSKIYEKVIEFLSTFSSDDRKLHKTMIAAAVKIKRTSTSSNDRGNGLQDLLTFIRERKQGYISILSLKGLYKYTMLNGKESEKSVSFNNPILGTLIIWSVSLEK